jgi:uncharacterized repeat protein (TIGR03803 family)
MDATGNLYGTTFAGGTQQRSGTVFKLAPDGTETVLHSFCMLIRCRDGAAPENGSLVMDTDGNLYGTTYYGGGVNDGGTVFKLAPDGTETVLYRFCRLGGTHCLDGQFPAGGLIIGTDGNLYGTTSQGGGGTRNRGTVFELTPNTSRTAWTETALYSFCRLDARHCTDGAGPSGGLIMDAAGNLYGTTANGGIGEAGVVFELVKSP